MGRKIDELSIWNKAVTANEITVRLYNSGYNALSPTSNSMVSYASSGMSANGNE